MRASTSDHHTHRPDGPVSGPVSVIVIAVLSALSWWAVLAIVGVALGLHP